MGEASKTLPKTSHGRTGAMGGGFHNLPLLAKGSPLYEQQLSEFSPRSGKSSIIGHRHLATAFSRTTPYAYSRSEYASNPPTRRAIATSRT